MRYWRCKLRRDWIILLGFVFCSIVGPIPSFALTSHVLKDVRMVEQNGKWHVVLTGSDSLPYKVIKATDPLRVVVDMPNTLSKIAIKSPVMENEFISTIKTVQFSPTTQPLARVEIGLKKDTSYRINQVQEKIWVSFDSLDSATKDKPVQVEPLAETKVEVPPVDAGAAKKAAALQTIKEEPMVSSQAAARKTLPPAGKILAIEWSSSEEEINFDIVGDGRLADYNAFELTDPPRLVVDFFGVKSAEVEKPMNLKGPRVKRIRFAIHPGKVRVVFDLIEAPQRKAAYKITLNGDRMQISFKPGSGSPAKQAIKGEKRR